MNGIDVSHFQGMIDWHNVKAENNGNVDFCFIKATEGQNYIDTMVKHNAIGASKYGIPLSYYHFATLNSRNVIADAQAEANHFVSVIDKYPKNNFPVALDIESNKAELIPAEVSMWIATFFDTITNLGIGKYFLYSYTPFLNANLPKNHSFGHIPLWIAAYTKTLKLPEGWNKEDIWQYSAKGKINGITGNVDLNMTDKQLF